MHSPAATEVARIAIGRGGQVIHELEDPQVLVHRVAGRAGHPVGGIRLNPGHRIVVRTVVRQEFRSEDRFRERRPVVPLEGAGGELGQILDAVLSPFRPRTSLTMRFPMKAPIRTSL